MQRRTASWVFIVLTAGLGLTAISGPEVIYEPFDYPAGDIDKSQTGGIGFTSTGWDTSGVDNFDYDVVSPGLTLAGLPTAGLSAARPAPDKSGEMHRPISISSQTNLLADNTTIWFSVLVNNLNYSDSNESGTLLIATGPVTDASVRPVLISGGEGLGMSFNSTTKIHGLAIDDGVSTYSTGFLTVWVAPGNRDMGSTNLIVGKIEWAPNGSNDVLRLFHVTDLTTDYAPLDSSAFATNMADLDQSAFDTIAMGNAQISLFDEIRYGREFHHVLGRETPTVGIIITVR